MPTFEKDRVTYCKKILEAKREKLSEIEIVVPDTSGDVLEIISADTMVSVTETRVSEGNAEIEGRVKVFLLCRTEDGDGIICLTGSQDMAERVENPALSANTPVRAELSKGYINARLINSRKLGVKCSTVMVVTAEKNQEQETLSGGENVEILSGSFSYSELLGAENRTIRIEEDIELPSGTPAVGEKLYTMAEAYVEEHKLINNKIIAKGKLKVTPYYVSTDGELFVHDAEVPFTHIFSIDGVDDSTSCVINMAVRDITSEVYENESGEARIIAIEADVDCEAIAYSGKEASVCLDAYCLDHGAEVQTEKAVFMGPPQVVGGEASVQGEVKIDGEILRVLAVTGEAAVSSAEPENGSIKFEGTLQVNVIAQTEGGIKNSAASIPFTISAPVGQAQGPSCENPRAFVNRISYTISGSDTVEVRANVAVRCCMRAVATAEIVTELAETGVKAKPKSEYVVICYPEENERFWDIAKRYGVGTAAIKEINGCDGEVCTRRMLLIPKA